jgi:hypothetical protein
MPDWYPCHPLPVKKRFLNHRQLKCPFERKKTENSQEKRMLWKDQEGIYRRMERSAKPGFPNPLL